MVPEVGLNPSASRENCLVGELTPSSSPQHLVKREIHTLVESARSASFLLIPSVSYDSMPNNGDSKYLPHC